MSEIEETQPKQTQPMQVHGRRSNAEKKPRRPIRWSGVLIFILLIVVGAGAGFGIGILRRVLAQKAEQTAQLDSQYQLGMQALQAGQYEVARQHLEYVINADPNYPGVMTAYAELQLRMRTSPTPTLTPTPTISPTPDLRGVNEILSRIQQLLSAKPQTVQEWDEVITNLDSLRKTDPTFHTAEVDGWYYTALRERGIAKIVAPTCPEVNFEGGIYDLTLAERFGPLDAVAASLRTFARMYINGSSFWDQDWVQAQSFFEQAMNLYPGLPDSTCQTAQERWRYATIQRAINLANAGFSCQAQEQFDAAYNIPSNDNARTYDLATMVYNACHPATAVPPATNTPTGSPPTATP